MRVTFTSKHDVVRVTMSRLEVKQFLSTETAVEEVRNGLRQLLYPDTLKLKAMPGTPMTEEELRAQTQTVSDAAKATEHFTDDELERH